MVRSRAIQRQTLRLEIRCRSRQRQDRPLIKPIATSLEIGEQLGDGPRLTRGFFAQGPGRVAGDGRAHNPIARFGISRSHVALQPWFGGRRRSP